MFLLDLVLAAVMIAMDVGSSSTVADFYEQTGRPQAATFYRHHADSRITRINQQIDYY